MSEVSFLFRIETKQYQPKKCFGWGIKIHKNRLWLLRFLPSEERLAKRLKEIILKSAKMKTSQESVLGRKAKTERNNNIK